MADTNVQSTSNSKFHVNVLTEVGKIADVNTEQQMQGQVYNSNRLENASKGLGHLSEAMGNLDTDASGFSLGLKIAVGVGVAVGIAVIGLGLSCLAGPEMEVAADAIDAVILEGVADDVAADLVEGTAGKATKKAVETGSEGAAKMTRDSLEVSTKSVRESDGSITNTIKVKNKNNGNFTREITEVISPEGDVSTTEKYTKKTYTISKPSVSAGGVSTGVTLVGLAEGGAAALNGSKKTEQANEFTKANTMLNSGASQLNNGIGVINSTLSQEESAIQGNQAMFSTALSAAQSVRIPPVGA